MVVFKFIIIAGGVIATGLILKKLNTMANTASENIREVLGKLEEANAKADRIQADVTKLTGMIGGTGDVPTAEEWAEVKAAADNLNNKLQGIDDQTAEDADPGDGDTPTT